MGIVVIGAVFVDIKGYPLSTYIPAGRNAGRIEQVHGGVSRNVAEDIANVELRPTFVGLVDDTGMGQDVIDKLDNHKVNTKYIQKVPDGMGTWLAIFDNDGDVHAAIYTSIPADPNVKNYSYAIVDGQVYYRENSRMVRPDLNATAEARVKGLVGLRDCVQELIDLQMDAAVPDSTIREKQAELNSLYDSFSAKYGLINDRANRLAYADDSSYYLLCALEVIDEDGKLERKADMFTKRTIKPHQAVAVVDTASEALAVSISEKACVDMDYMSQLTGKTKEELAGELQGVIFRVPGQLEQDRTPHYVTADEYLSGNVRRKLRQAQRAAQQDPVYAVNVEALTAAQPKDLDASEIEVRLGATWIDKEYIQQFMYETFNTPDRKSTL